MYVSKKTYYKTICTTISTKSTESNSCRSSTTSFYEKQTFILMMHIYIGLWSRIKVTGRVHCMHRGRKFSMFRCTRALVIRGWMTRTRRADNCFEGGGCGFILLAFRMQIPLLMNGLRGAMVKGYCRWKKGARFFAIVSYRFCVFICWMKR